MAVYEIVAQHPSPYRGGGLLIHKGRGPAYSRIELIHTYAAGDDFVVRNFDTDKFLVLRRVEMSLETVASFDDKDAAIMALRLLI